MTITARLRAFTETAVIVDDNYKDPNLGEIEDTQWAELRGVSPESWASLAGNFPGVKTALELRRHPQHLETAWKLYKGDAQKYSLFDPIFRGLLDQYEGELIQLRPLTDFLRNDAKLEVKCHASLEEAEADIRTCKLVFLDFYLEQLSGADKVIELFSRYRDCLKGDVLEDGKPEGRFIYLMSSKLPIEKMEEFRKATSLKSAFFRFVGKDSLTSNWLERDLEPKLGLYRDMRRLGKYLDIFSLEIAATTKSLVEEIDSLELHDLTLLHSLRLEREAEGLGEYLGWIFSEALAAKVRDRARLHAAAHSINRIQALPFNGEVEPNSVLLDLYADISFSTLPRPNGKNPAARFGDVYSENADISRFLDSPSQTGSTATRVGNRLVGASPTGRRPVALNSAAMKLSGNMSPLSSARARARWKRNQFRRDGFLLTISPACDLQRCSSDYQVMLVRGHVAEKSPNLEDLLAAKPFAGSYHLLRDESRKSYLLVKWDEKSCVMVPARDLRDPSKYILRGRLNEVLCHETKELALRHLGRVGVQVDPSFSIALGGIFHLKVGANDVRAFPVPEGFIAGVRIEGNGNNDHRYVLSRALGSWLREQLEPFQDAQGVLPFKLPRIVEFLDGENVPQFDWDDKNAATKGKTVANNSLKVLLHKDRSNLEPTSENELILYPRTKNLA